MERLGDGVALAAHPTRSINRQEASFGQEAIGHHSAHTETGEAVGTVRRQAKPAAASSARNSASERCRPVPNIAIICMSIR